MSNRYRFMGPPQALRRQSVKLDYQNMTLVPGNLLPYKRAYQEIANGLPKGGILIMLPKEVKQRRVFEKTVAQLKNKGRRITTIYDLGCSVCPPSLAVPQQKEASGCLQIKTKLLLAGLSPRS